MVNIFSKQARLQTAHGSHHSAGKIEYYIYIYTNIFTNEVLRGTGVMCTIFPNMWSIYVVYLCGSV